MLSADEDLIKKSQQGDQKAFEQLIIKYEKKVYTIAYRMMGNHEDASDLAQEAFIKVFRSIKSFRGEASFSTWIYHVVANVCRDQLRKQKVKVNSLDEPVAYEGERLEKQLQDSGKSPEEKLEENELKAYLQRLINQLPDEYRLVLVLREFMDFSYEEIAGELNITMGTVKSRLNRARTILKNKLLAEREQNLVNARQIR
ncbi:MAG: sigma-70 family RNA polymerase sigma factor [Clostridia bacterium]|nr:sigma-70 family RNA polymerase sigma factor [Clostridia bacterium]